MLLLLLKGRKTPRDLKKLQVLLVATSHQSVALGIRIQRESHGESNTGTIKQAHVHFQNCTCCLYDSSCWVTRFRTLEQRNINTRCVSEIGLLARSSLD